MHRRIDQDVEEYHRHLEWYCEDRGLWLEGGPSIDAACNQSEIAQCAFAALGPNPYEDFCITCENRMGYVEGAYCTVVWDREIEKWIPEWEHVYCRQANLEQKQIGAPSNNEVGVLQSSGS